MKKITLKNDEIVKTRDLLKALVEKNMTQSVKFQYAIISNLRRVFNPLADDILQVRDSKTQPYQIERQNLAIKYAKKDANGQPIVNQSAEGNYVQLDPDTRTIHDEELLVINSKYKETAEELKAFLETKVDIDVYEIDLKEVPSLDLQTMDGLYNLIKEE